jgi:hypothetical protein
MRERLILLACAVVALSACASERTVVVDDTERIELTDDAEIVYRFGDSSVPPEYHRSYTLTVTKNELHVVVDSYGDIINDVVRPTSPEAWSILVTTFEGVAGVESVENDDGCAGGTSSSLRIVDNRRELVDVGVSNCGGSGGSEAEALDLYIKPVIDSLADWEGLLDRES